MYMRKLSTSIFNVKSFNSKRVFGKHSYIRQQKKYGTVSFDSRYGAKDTPVGLKKCNSPIRILPLPLSTRPQRERKKFLSDQFFNETSRSSILNGIFFFLPTARTQQAKSFSISTRIIFLTHNEKAASKGFFPHFYEEEAA